MRFGNPQIIPWTMMLQGQLYYSTFHGVRLGNPQIIPWTPKARCSRNTIQGQLYYSAFHGCVLATSNIPWSPIAHCVRNTIQGQLYYSAFHGCVLATTNYTVGQLSIHTKQYNEIYRSRGALRASGTIHTFRVTQVYPGRIY